MISHDDGADPGSEAADDAAVPPPSRPRSAGGGSVLAAAMLAVGEIIEPQNTAVEIQEEAPSDLLDGPGVLNLDFGDLPEL